MKVLHFLGYDPQPQPETVGQAPKWDRQVRGMSRLELASRLGVDQGTLGRWERGTRRLTGEFVTIVDRLLAIEKRAHHPKPRLASERVFI